MTARNDQTLPILLADDDEDDRFLTIRAFKDSKLLNPIFTVADGEELMDYLRHCGKYSDPAISPRPAIILLDLNMPRKDGREALREIKSDPDLRSIPVVVFTTSDAEQDLLLSYHLGTNSFIRKPVEFQGLVNIMKNIGSYWFQIVELPVDNDDRLS